MILWLNNNISENYHLTSQRSFLAKLKNNFFYVLWLSLPNIKIRDAPTQFILIQCNTDTMAGRKGRSDSSVGFSPDLGLLYIIYLCLIYLCLQISRKRKNTIRCQITDIQSRHLLSEYVKLYKTFNSEFKKWKQITFLIALYSFIKLLF